MMVDRRGSGTVWLGLNDVLSLIARHVVVVVVGGGGDGVAVVFLAYPHPHYSNSRTIMMI